MPTDGFNHFIECHLTKVFSIEVFASTGFDSWEAIPLMDRVKVIHGVCTGCHLMVFTTS
jgi:hypothetical protein